jgi:hypothetical protein
MKKNYCNLSLLLLIALLSACVSRQANLVEKNIPSESIFSQGKSLVFGEVHWIENGERKKIGSSIFDFYIKPSIVRLEDKSRILCDVGEDGAFSWALDPGTYVIDRIEYRDTWSGNYFFVPKVAFRITDAKQAYYIGTLKSEVKTKRDFIGGLSGTGKFTILDQGEANCIFFSTKNQIPLDEIQKSLMIQSDKLPTSFTSTQEFHLGLQIINAILMGL